MSTIVNIFSYYLLYHKPCAKMNFMQYYTYFAQESIDAAKDDRCIGHLLILLQLEWPSGPAELIFTHILETIKRNGSFRYFPFFSEFVIEPDFLETFMSISNHQNKAVKLELFPAAASSSG